MEGGRGLTMMTLFEFGRVHHPHLNPPPRGGGSLLAVLFMLFAFVAHAGQTQLQLDRTNPDNNKAGELRFLGAVVIPMGADKVGGLSDLYIGPRDTQWIAEADTGKLYTGHLQWTNGRLTGATLDKGAYLLDENGKPPTSRARWDAESLARLPDGSWLMGYERDHRVEHFEDDGGKPGGTPKPLPPLPGITDLPRNQGLEALTVLKDDSVLAIAEGQVGDTNPAWLWQEGHWQELSYQSAEGLSPSDAATLPGGDVLVLERGLSFFYGFRSRIVRVKAADIHPGAVLQGEVLAMLTSPLLTENFEGIHTIPGPDGTARIFIVSDNNVNILQQAILAAFELSSP